jgi:hypothetical protein
MANPFNPVIAREIQDVPIPEKMVIHAEDGSKAGA